MASQKPRRHILEERHFVDITLPLAEAVSYACIPINRAADTIFILAPLASPSVFDICAVVRAIKSALLRGVRITAILPAASKASEDHPLFTLVGQRYFVMFLFDGTPPNRTIILVDKKNVFTYTEMPPAKDVGEPSLTFTMHIWDSILGGKIFQEILAVRNRSQLYRRRLPEQRR